MTRMWLKHPVLWHSSRVPSGYNYTAMTPWQIELIRTPWHDWYTADWDYGLSTVYFFCAAIAFFAIGNAVFRLRQTKGENDNAIGDIHKIPLYTRAVALSRALGAKQFRATQVQYYSPPLSAIVIVLGMITYFAALAFSVHPYLWPNIAMGHSPPIATRSGWISVAILPFLLVFATKVNLIGILTGVSHEKLQVYHRWSAWIMYITSLIHTFPFIVQSIRMGEMTTNWNTTPWYWTGVAALVPQTWLVFMSWGPIRNRYYETFKKLHFIASGVFVAALFVHCNFRLTSWDYIGAAAGLYVVSWLVRFGRTFYNSFCTDVAAFEALPGDAVKVTIPSKLKWSAGQHFFIRFLDLGVHAATSHPFTVATLSGGSTSEDSVCTMELYVKVHGGITKRLATLCQGGGLRSSRVLLDGPYGGVEGNLKVYDRVLLLAGGSGITFVVPLLLDIVRNSVKDSSQMCRNVHLVWAVRTPCTLTWFEDVLSAAAKGASEGFSVRISYYITGISATTTDETSSTSEKSGLEQAITKDYGRPVLRDIVSGFCEEAGTVGIAACGPESFNFDVGNAVSECELAIARGRARCSEIYLHQESYSW
ncbi:ferric reductase NAD binding domain-containing protein [Cubamyces lactineus]|nr:ferric reductase NAD binding domain-containing protein [Cubamyces lactineus]